MCGSRRKVRSQGGKPVDVDQAGRVGGRMVEFFPAEESEGQDSGQSAQRSRGQR